MRWLEDDTMRHRIIGLAVLLAVAMVIVPAMLKKSSQQLERSMHLALHQHPKPAFPTIVEVKPAALFKTVKVAHVVLPAMDNPKQAVTIAAAQSLSGKTVANRSLIEKSPVMMTRFAKATPHAEPKINIASAKLNKVNKISPPAQRQLASAKPVGSIQKSSPVPLLKSDVFAVQIASFSQQGNALSLVNTLKGKGFKAAYEKQGNQYRVLVGELAQLDQAKHLQQQLASATQLTGFIVKVG
jgi:DedD protein